MATSDQIRQQFIDFFAQKHGHTAVASAPVVPHEDPTLLFTNAGMNQFKDVFLGTGERNYTRAVDTQKCIRAGGKHNDLEDVGKDTYHHTFFEMLGNWSFGDYFKKEAIDWAWELLVEVWGLDPKRLHATYFEGDPENGLGPDEEARDLWLKHLPAGHVHRGDKKDNFWEMGDTGPCGPCSEVHIDLTDDLSGAALVNADDARVIEIWNLVFIQFNRARSGELGALPARHVDTGMGFERICAVLQDKPSNYDTDVFTPLFEAIGEVTGARGYQGTPGKTLGDPIDTAYRVIADHIRCLTFALTDGAVPSNEGRGYVLRRILRRAVRHGRQTLGVHEPFLCKLVPAVADHMGGAFPELRAKPDQVAMLIEEEEESFGRTLDRGIELFVLAAYDAFVRQIRHEEEQKALDLGSRLMFEYEGDRRSPDASVKLQRTQFGQTIDAFNLRDLSRDIVRKYTSETPVISADDAFTLYDTFGFPLDLTQVMAEERGMSVDMAGVETLMAQARERSKATGGGVDHKASLIEVVQQFGDQLPATEFIGEGLNTEVMSEATPIFLFASDAHGYAKTDQLDAEEHGAVVVARTPFYAEAGGQVGDTGTIQVRATSGGGARFKVEDTVKVGGVWFHLGRVVAGTLEATVSGSRATLAMAVDRDRRHKIMANHTTTHVMNRALRSHVNDQADQRGSLVNEDRLRFDFAQPRALTPQQIERVEGQVHDDIAADLPVHAEVAPQERALAIRGLRAVFGEKYPPKVRVVSIGVPVGELLSEPESDRWADYSVEFCGGTHLGRTGEAEDFAIVGEEAVAKGVRRITALTGEAAYEARDHGRRLLRRVEALREAPLENLAEQLDAVYRDATERTLPLTLKSRILAGVAELSERAKQVDKDRQKARAEEAVSRARELADRARGPVIVARLEDVDAGALRSAMDVVKKKHPQAAILIAGVSEGKVALMAAVPKAMIDAGLKAGDWVKAAAEVVGGGGGGRPDQAQAGGKDPSKTDEALEAARSFATERV